MKRLFMVLMFVGLLVGCEGEDVTYSYVSSVPNGIIVVNNTNDDDTLFIDNDTLYSIGADNNSVFNIEFDTFNTWEIVSINVIE